MRTSHSLQLEKARTQQQRPSATKKQKEKRSGPQIHGPHFCYITFSLPTHISGLMEWALWPVNWGRKTSDSSAQQVGGTWKWRVAVLLPNSLTALNNTTGGDPLSRQGFEKSAWWWLRRQRIHLPMQGTQVRSLGWENPLEEEMATHSSILAWKISWIEEPGRLQSMGSQRVRQDWAINTLLSLSSGDLSRDIGYGFSFSVHMLGPNSHPWSYGISYPPSWYCTEHCFQSRNTLPGKWKVAMDSESWNLPILPCSLSSRSSLIEVARPFEDVLDAQLSGKTLQGWARSSWILYMLWVAIKYMMLFLP